MDLQNKDNTAKAGTKLYTGGKKDGGQGDIYRREARGLHTVAKDSDNYFMSLGTVWGGCKTYQCGGLRATSLLCGEHLLLE